MNPRSVWNEGFSDETGQYAEMNTGATRLGFVSLELAKATGVEIAESLPGNLSPAMEIGLVTDDVEGAFKKAVAAGAEPVVKPMQKPWGQTVSYVRDIDCFLVEICSPMG